MIFVAATSLMATAASYCRSSFWNIIICCMRPGLHSCGYACRPRSKQSVHAWVWLRPPWRRRGSVARCPGIARRLLRSPPPAPLSPATPQSGRPCTQTALSSLCQMYSGLSIGRHTQGVSCIACRRNSTITATVAETDIHIHH